MMIGHGNTLIYRVLHFKFESKPFETFLNDLDKKTGVFIAKRHTDQKVVGFSTATTFDVQIDGRPVPKKSGTSRE